MRYGKEVVQELKQPDAREDFLERVQGKRFCYYIPHVPEDSGEFRPSVVVEGEAGHYPMNYTWGKDRAIAERVAKGQNKHMGISETDAMKIVASSMAMTAVIR